MDTSGQPQTASVAIDALDVPETVKRALGVFAGALRRAFGNNLHSLVLFGSAAEGRMRPHSDVNLMVVLEQADAEALEHLSMDYRAAHAAARVNCMFIRRDEVPAALKSFAVKFEDIAHRRQILLGADPFAGLSMSADDMRRRVREDLLNLSLRLRERYAFHSASAEQYETVILEASSAVRAAAVALLTLSGGPRLAPREALEKLIESGDPAWRDTLERLSAVRQAKHVSRAAMARTVMELGAIVEWMRRRIGD